MRVPNEILYNIFLSSNDYTTLYNMTFLDKEFNNYIKNTKLVYKHKYTTLYNNLFKYLELFDTTHFDNFNDISIISINHMKFLYNIYKNIIKNEFIECFGEKRFNAYPEIIYIIMINGTSYLDKAFKVSINKNKIKLIVHDESYILKYIFGGKFTKVNNNFKLLEDFFNAN